MKNIRVLVPILAITALFALGAWKATGDKSAAKARQVQGLYIFNDCLPVNEYEVLGSVKGLGFMSFKSVQYESLRDKMIQRAKADYPEGEGLILDLRDGGTDRADVIKFK